jgi:hypothetical protein
MRTEPAPSAWLELEHYTKPSKPILSQSRPPDPESPSCMASDPSGSVFQKVTGRFHLDDVSPIRVLKLKRICFFFLIGMEVPARPVARKFLFFRAGPTKKFPELLGLPEPNVVLAPAGPKCRSRHRSLLGTGQLGQLRELFSRSGEQM